MRIRKILSISPLVIVLAALSACGSKSNKQIPALRGAGATENPSAESDTLPNTPSFDFKVDETVYKIDSAEVKVYYSGTDATIRIDAGADETGRLSLVIEDLKNLPGFRGNGWKGGNVIQPGEDSASSQPTVTFYKNLGIISSWNNLDDGFHKSLPEQDGSLFIYGIQQTGQRNFLIKGRIRTKVLKNKYESSAGDFNRDHEISGTFVVSFEDYWLKL